MSGDVFIDDPLRIVRGFSFMANYNFLIDKTTLRFMTEHRALLHHVSGERLGEEFLKIFKSPNAFKTLKLLDKTFVIDEIIFCAKDLRGMDHGPYHHLDVWGHSLEAVRCFEKLYDEFKKHKNIFKYLNTCAGNNRMRYQIVKLACLLHDIGKPLTRKVKNGKLIFHAHEKVGRDLAKDIIARLRLSGSEGLMLKNLIYWHMRPGHLAGLKELTPRAKYRFFRDCGADALGVIFVCLSDWRAMRGPKLTAKERKVHERIMLGFLKEYFVIEKKVQSPKIINGHDIMEKLKLSPSPLIGDILKAVYEKQALGKITTKEEAFKFALVIANKRGGKNV